MKNIYIILGLLLLNTIIFTSCSKEPYYERANKASEKAHDRLSND